MRSLTVAGAGGLRLAATERSGDLSKAQCKSGKSTVSSRFPDLLMLHGFGQTQSAWNNSAQVLAGSGYRVLTSDARGHGRSARLPSGDYRIQQLVDDARLLSAHLGEDDPRPVAIGASMGGLTALVAEAESATPVFSALVLVDITPRWESAGVARILDFMTARPEGFDSVAEAAQYIARYLPHRDPRQPGDGLRELLHPDSDGRLQWHWDPALIPLARNAEQIQQRLSAAASIVTVPTLLISGTRSDVVSAQGINEFLDAIPHAEHEVVNDARHLVAGDDNDAFNAIVLRFLKKLNFVRSPGLKESTRISA